METADPILTFIYFMAVIVIIYVFTKERNTKGF